MKTLKELTDIMTRLPCGFAESSTETIPHFPKTSETETNFADGFVVKYATDPVTTDGEYLKRIEVTRLGEMATRELHFRQAGGDHTFSTTVSTTFNGYPEGGVLGYYDGEYLRSVESQETGNTANFVTDPEVIDSMTRKPEEASTVSKRRLWKSRNYIYGIGIGTMNIIPDFSRREDLSGGKATAQDSLIVIGANYYPCGNADMVLSALKVNITVTNSAGASSSGVVDLSNKGRCGLTAGSFIVGYTSTLLGPTAVPASYVSNMSGVSNYDFSFFAKKGTSVAVEIVRNPSEQFGLHTLTVSAYPLVKEVVFVTEVDE